MQFALFASLAILYSTALAAPSERRDDDSLIDVLVGLTNVLNGADVNVLSQHKRGDPDSLVGVGVLLTNVLNGLDVNVLSQRDALSDVEAGMYHP
ncbi:uncharacterized protein EDB91DRAFT_174875 [Suillus paluster]|uniref:uncharacterized protein n=1 Tax=Suillus paluster TaxID=48578 RepID=UPI001B871E5D|nr:uncharacterized protein EDB91DRAFT_174875 [Suillus paluster]KAG1745093.1 hypothetical protein EDB91DRAFT_174875 [Suillus paluster]